MTIENLVEVLPPPGSPTYTFSGPWTPIGALIRTELPQDYKDLARLYGDGQFFEFFGLYHPASPSPWGKFPGGAFQTNKAYSENNLLPMYPQPGGLLAIGQTDNGDHIFWLTRGLVSEWPIVVCDRDGDDVEIFECDLTDFLAGIISGKIWPRVFGDEDGWRSEVEAFVPTADPWPETA